MARLMWILSILALVSGCSNPISPIIGSDYFPLCNGAKWTYKSGDDEEVFSMISSSEDIFTLLDEGRERCLRKKDLSLKERYEESVVVNGEKIILDTLWENVLKFPLLIGETWADTYHLEKFYNGDTLKKDIILSCSVIEKTNLSLPYGRINNAFRLIRKRYEFSEGSVDSIVQEEWYGPDIGLVRRESNPPLWLKKYECQNLL